MGSASIRMSFAGIVNVGWRRARAPENVDIELVVVESSGRAYERLDAQIRVANKIDMDVKGKPAPNLKQTQRPQQLAMTGGYGRKRRGPNLFITSSYSTNIYMFSNYRMYNK